MCDAIRATRRGVIGQDNMVEYENTIAPGVTLADVAPLFPYPSKHYR